MTSHIFLWVFHLRCKQKDKGSLTAGLFHMFSATILDQLWFSTNAEICNCRASLAFALAITIIFRMSATRATSGFLPREISSRYQIPRRPLLRATAMADR